MTGPSVTNVRAALQEAARRAEAVRLAAIAEAERIKAEHDAQRPTAEDGTTGTAQAGA